MQHLQRSGVLGKQVHNIGLTTKTEMGQLFQKSRIVAKPVENGGALLNVWKAVN